MMLTIRKFQKDRSIGIINALAFLAGGIAVMTFAGCATEPNRADLMRGHVSQVQAQGQAEGEFKEQLATDWERGQELIRSGKENIDDGQALVEVSEQNLRKGKDQIERGKRELAEGNRLTAGSEERFQDAFDDARVGGAQ